MESKQKNGFCFFFMFARSKSVARLFVCFFVLEKLPGGGDDKEKKSRRLFSSLLQNAPSMIGPPLRVGEGKNVFFFCIGLDHTYVFALIEFSPIMHPFPNVKIQRRKKQLLQSTRYSIYLFLSQKIFLKASL